tara:strand:- start:812 stop:1087 length:276 start_codon:yes stop_codon:yes gene_type:complete
MTVKKMIIANLNKDDDTNNLDDLVILSRDQSDLIHEHLSNLQRQVTSCVKLLEQCGINEKWSRNRSITYRDFMKVHDSFSVKNGGIAKNDE